MKTARYSKTDKEQIINTLMQGGLLAFPTDTVFGLGCIMDRRSMERIYETKGRDKDKALPFMCDGAKMTQSIAVLDDRSIRVIDRLMPGALTVVLKKKEWVEDLYTAGRDTVAVRIPNDDFILELIKELGRPLLVTSANISGEGSLLRWEDVYACMNGKIEGIVCDDARGDRASTIVDLSGEEMKILREGPISEEDLKEAIK